jgi:hypothetical protein
MRLTFPHIGASVISAPHSFEKYEARLTSLRLIRRAGKPGVLILEITEQNPGDRRPEQRLVMEKQ